MEWIETNSELETYILENRKIKFYEPEFNYHKNLDLYNADDIKINNLTQKLLVKNLSFVALLPNSEREKTIDIYFINNGKFIKSFTVGAKSNLDLVFDEIHNIFYSDTVEYNDWIDLDEIRIINNWLRKYDIVSKVFLYDKQDELIFFEKIENGIKSFYNEPAEKNDFYINTFIYE
jgi:hypothetical protein